MQRLISKSARMICSFLTIPLLIGTGGNELFLNQTVYAAEVTNEDGEIADEFFYKNIKQLALSDTHALCLDKSGCVYSQGTNIYGQLGSDDTSNSLDELRAFDLSGCLPEISRVWAFDNVSFFLAQNGSMYACGDNSNGQLGLTESYYSVPTRIDLLKRYEVEVEDVLYSNGATFFLTADKRVFACGNNEFGWFGIGSSNNRESLQELPLGDITDGLVDFAIGDGFAVAVNDSGELYFVGNNTYGQCGFHSVEKKNYSTFVKMPIAVMELDEACYHKQCEISGYKLFAGGNLYSVAPGCIVDEQLSQIYGIPIGEEVYPELLIFNISDDILDDYFLGVFEQPFQTKIEKKDVSCKKITNFSTSSGPKYIYSIENVYHTHDFTAVFGKGNTGGMFLTGVGKTKNINWSGFSVDDGIMGSFPLFSPQNGNDGLIGTDISFSKNHFIYQAINENEEVRYLYNESDEVVDIDRSQWFPLVGPYLYLTEEDVKDGFFETVNNPVLKEFAQDSLKTAINASVEVSFETQGNTNFEFHVADPKICSIQNVSADKRTITLRGLNEGSTVLKAIETSVDGKESVVDTCNIQVEVKPEYINGHFDKQQYVLTEGESSYIEFASDVKDLKVDITVKDKSIAAINEFMQLSAIAPGTTKVMATYKGNVLAEAEVIVSPYSEELQMKCHEAKLLVGKTVPASDYVSIIPSSEKENLEYVSENPDICTVHNGILTAMKSGTAMIKVTHPSGVVGYIKAIVIDNTMSSGDITIVVSKLSYELNKGSSIGLDISSTPISELKNVTLSSENPAICTVDNNTKSIHAVNVGETYVNVTHPKTGTLRVQVIVYAGANIVAPKEKEVLLGEKTPLGVTIMPESEKGKVTYRSEDSGVCSVTNDGILQGLSVGRTKVYVFYDGAKYAETDIIVRKSEGNPDKDEKHLSYDITNKLNKKGDLELSVGEKLTLNVRLKNASSDDKKSDYEPRIRVISGKNRIKVEDTNDDFKFEITGKKEGTATIELYHNKKDIEPLKVDIDISFLELDEDKVSISTGIIKDDTVKDDDSDMKKNSTKIEVGNKHQIKISGTNKLDMDKYFDSYFDVSVNGDSVEYRGDGVVKAVKPGFSTVTIEEESTDTKLGKIRYWVPFPKEYFTEYPGGLAVPKDREIEIRFNDTLRPSTVTANSVFIQSGTDGNGDSLQAEVRVVGDKVCMKLKESSKVAAGKYYIFFTDDIRSAKDNEIISPICIPINLIDRNAK